MADLVGVLDLDGAVDLPVITNLTLEAGDDKVLRFTIGASANGQGRFPTLEGCETRWWLGRSEFSTPDRALQKIGVILDQTARVFDVMLARSDTLELLGEFYHEASVKAPGGEWTTTSYGMLTLQKTLIREE